jgi:hypothetical protein
MASYVDLDAAGTRVFAHDRFEDYVRLVGENGAEFESDLGSALDALESAAGLPAPKSSVAWDEERTAIDPRLNALVAERARYEASQLLVADLIDRDIPTGRVASPARDPGAAVYLRLAVARDSR